MRKFPINHSVKLWQYQRWLLDFCPFCSTLFFYLFPFNVVFNENMVIMAMGAGLKTIMDDAYGKAVDEVFTLMKPPISFSYANVSPETLWKLYQRIWIFQGKLKVALMKLEKLWSRLSRRFLNVFTQFTVDTLISEFYWNCFIGTFIRKYSTITVVFVFFCHYKVFKLVVINSQLLISSPNEQNNETVSNHIFIVFSAFKTGVS